MKTATQGRFQLPFIDLDAEDEGSDDLDKEEDELREEDEEDDAGRDYGEGIGFVDLDDEEAFDKEIGALAAEGSQKEAAEVDADLNDILLPDETDDVGSVQWWNELQRIQYELSSIEVLDQNFTTLSPEEVRNMKTDAVNALFAQQSAVTSDQSWSVKKIVETGTVNDKFGTWSLQVSNDPMKSLNAIDKLLDLAREAPYRFTELALSTLRDLFLYHLLPPFPFPNLSLPPMVAFQGNQGNKRKNHDNNPHNILWLNFPAGVFKKYITQDMMKALAFAEQLDQRYLAFLTTIEATLKADFDYTRRIAVRILGQLLLGRPQHRAQYIVSILINKMGDDTKAISSKSALLLQRVLEKHLNILRIPTIKETIGFLYRPHLSRTAQYYGLVLLTSIPLQSGDTLLAADSLLSVYFHLFNQWLSEEESARKQLLEGRAEKLEKKKQSKKAVWLVRRQKEKQKAKGIVPAPKAPAPNLDFQGRLIIKLLAGITRTIRILPSAEGLAEKHLTTLYGLCQKLQFSGQVAALRLITTFLERAKLAFSNAYYVLLYQALSSPEALTSSHSETLLNVVFTAMKQDHSIPRTQAFVKRLLQISFSAPPQFTSAVLMKLGQQTRSSSFYSLITQPEEAIKEQKEHYVDADKKVEKRSYSEFLLQKKGEKKGERKNEKKNEKQQNQGSRKARPNRHEKIQSMLKGYDATEKNPLKSGAQNTCLWELVPFLKHYHQTIVNFADTLRSGKSLPYSKAKPSDFSLLAFLERFSNKKPIMKNRTPGDTAEHPLVTGEMEEFKKFNLHPDDHLVFMKFFTDKSKLKREHQADEASIESDDVSDLYAGDEDAFEEDYGDNFEGEVEGPEDPSDDEADDDRFSEEQQQGGLRDEVFDNLLKARRSGNFAAASELAELLQDGDDQDIHKRKRSAEGGRKRKGAKLKKGGAKKSRVASSD